MAPPNRRDAVGLLSAIWESTPTTMTSSISVVTGRFHQLRYTVSTDTAGVVGWLEGKGRGGVAKDLVGRTGITTRRIVSWS